MRKLNLLEHKYCRGKKIVPLAEYVRVFYTLPDRNYDTVLFMQEQHKKTKA
jgi:hypothetical protein